MEHLQKLKARFHPKRVDDLTEAAKKYIGIECIWFAAWMIEAEDNSQYLGQYAMAPYDVLLPGLTWVPECDLESL